MPDHRRLTVVVVLALAAVAVFAFVGLPFARLGLTPVSAQYATSAEAACGSPVTTQVVFTAAVNLYSDAALTHRVATVTNLPAKFLVCSGAGTATALKVYFAGQIYWVALGPQLERSARFPQ